MEKKEETYFGIECWWFGITPWGFVTTISAQILYEGLSGWNDTPSFFCSAQCFNLEISKSNLLLATNWAWYWFCILAAFRQPSVWRLSNGMDIVAEMPHPILWLDFWPVLVGLY